MEDMKVRVILNFYIAFEFKCKCLNKNKNVCSQTDEDIQPKKRQRKPEYLCQSVAIHFNMK